MKDHSNMGKLMNAEELSAYLGISRNAAYTLLHRTDFPSIKIGNLLFAVRDQVDVWVTHQTRNGGYNYAQKERPR